MTIFRSRPSTVEAVQWTGNNGQEVIDTIGYTKVRINVRYGSTGAIEADCELLAGKNGVQEWVPVPVGHWLVHPPADLSDIWPVEDAYFRDKYEEI